MMNIKPPEIIDFNDETISTQAFLEGSLNS